MFFQYSPVLKDHKPKNNENREENDEVTHLSLAPFTTNPKIDFDVKVGTVVTKKLLIMNPTGKDFNIKITSTIPEDLHFSLSWTNSFIAKGQTVILDLVWEPIKEESSRYSLLFSDGRMRRTVFLTFKSVALTKKLKKNGKGKTPPKKQPFFRTSPRRKLPSGLKYTLPKVLITSPASSCERETFIINKENIPQIDGRETYTINEIPSIKRSKPNMDFDDSLENAAENIFVEEQNNFETKLRTLTFDLTPIKTPFIPNDSSTVTKESLNFTSTTYVKDNSFEMHIKSNNSYGTIFNKCS